MQTRRDFLARAGGTAAVAVLSPGSLAAAAAAPRASAAIFRGGRFAQGVMSGDPRPREITLWTKLSEVRGTGTLRLEVARDAGFRRLVARATLTASPDADHVVKVRLRGLSPHERYYYRFETRGAQSRAGRFQTALPFNSRQPVRFAVFSGQEFSNGFYHAHSLLAREDVDFVVNLGDYVYADPDPAVTAPVRRDRIGAATTLAQMRAKYDLYRSDSALRRVQQAFPLISTWGDNDVYEGVAGAALQPYADPTRIAAAARAYAENMPTFAVPVAGRRLFQALRYGRNVDLIMLDERSFRGRRSGPLLGEEQARFLEGRLLGSKATWKLIGNEVPIAQLQAPGSDDWWQAYPFQRNRLLDHVEARAIKDVCFLTGDAHAFYAADVRTADGTVVAPEFTCGSITSAINQDLRPLEANNPDVDEVDVDRHGYLWIQASPRQLDVRFRRIHTIKRRRSKRASNLRWVLPRGSTTIKGKRK